MISNITGIMTIPIVRMRCLPLILPMNISIIQVAPMSRAVERFAGAINRQTTATGRITGKNPFLKSFISSCFLLSSRLIYIIKASLARSEV